MASWPRTIAVRILASVLARHSRVDLLLDQWTASLDGRDRAWIQEAVYGVLRHYFSLEVDVSRFLRQKPDDAVRAILLLGACQLRHMRTPIHAVVNEMVNVCKQVAPAAAGMVNAVLRKVATTAAPHRLKPYQRAELPQWMYARWRDAFGADTVQSMLAGIQQKPVLSLAVFRERDAWIRQAEAAGFHAWPGALSPYAVLLPTGTPVAQLPGYAGGAFQVMDQAAQAAVLALPVRAGDTVLDVCAAPGGKSGLLAKIHRHVDIMAVEKSGSRLPRLRENLARLQASRVSVVQGDATALALPDASVHAVLLDAPCTASGVIRRHPDAKFLHGPDDVLRHAAIQRAMLTEALRVLKPGGHVLYAVCSIHPEENEQVVEDMPGLLRSRRLMPGEQHDGFFFAVIRKAP